MHVSRGESTSVDPGSHCSGCDSHCYMMIESRRCLSHPLAGLSTRVERVNCGIALKATF